jgi:membrane protease YdiL (CAAX protease family)
MAAVALLLDLPRPGAPSTTSPGMARLLFALAALGPLLVAAWQLRSEGQFRDWAGARDRLWLGPNLLRDVRTGVTQHPVRLLGVLVLLAGVWLLEVALLTFGTWLPPVLLLAFRQRWLAWPAFANPLDFGDLSGAGAGWLAVGLLSLWLGATIVGEELFFRGLLLPRMRSRTGQWSWARNALLQGIYYLPLPWLLPFRFLEGAILARLAARLQRNALPFALRTLKGVAFVALAGYGLSLTKFPPLSSLPELPHVTRRPPVSFPAGAGAYPLRALPHHDPQSPRQWQVDLRMRDVSGLDLRSAEADLLMANFDSRTCWPVAGKMPAGFAPARVMDLGRNPGLNIRQVHARGTTGKGVGIAIIDQVLLTTHQEYVSRLKWYEEFCTGASETARMHGAAVASIAVGKTVGVAPDADLYYFGYGDNVLRIALQNHLVASGIRRALEVNRLLPADRKIRAISISYGWSPWQAGYADAVSAARAAREAGLLVICSSVSAVHGFRFQGAGRAPLADPDAFASFDAGLFWSGALGRPVAITNQLLVPMDSRATASPTGDADYAFYREGGWSWAIPYIAGAYALALETDTALTPERFWQLALQTGHPLTATSNGSRRTVGMLLNPPRLLDGLKQ